MKIIVTGTRGIPDVMGGVETHCEELFPRIARRGEDVTVIRRSGSSFMKISAVSCDTGNTVSLPFMRCAVIFRLQANRIKRNRAFN